jgi:hypothetical protein
LSLHRKNTATTQPALIPPATQPLAEDPVLKPVFENKDVILRAGGISSLEAELERRFECQYPARFVAQRKFYAVPA